MNRGVVIIGRPAYGGGRTPRSQPGGHGVPIGELVRMAHRAQVAEHQVAETEALRVELRRRLDDDLTARYYTALQEIAERACTSSGLGGSCTYCAPCIARATLGEGPATRQRNEAA